VLAAGRGAAVGAERTATLAVHCCEGFLIASVLTLQLTLWKLAFYKDKTLSRSTCVHGRGQGQGMGAGWGGEKQAVNKAAGSNQTKKYTDSSCSYLAA